MTESGGKAGGQAVNWATVSGRAWAPRPLRPTSRTAGAEAHSTRLGKRPQET
jgi:hypothetical protein